MVMHRGPLNCVAFAGDATFTFLAYPLPTVGYWLTVALTGNGGLGFDSGEGARATATTSKEGSRRANYPILTPGGSDKINQYKASMFCNWSEWNVNLSEYRLEGKSGASSRGSSSSKGVY